MKQTKMTHDEIIAYVLAPLAPIDCEHDDLMDADDYDARRYQRDGWGESRYDRQRY
jgi:hypothetical protein